MPSARLDGGFPSPNVRVLPDARAFRVGHARRDPAVQRRAAPPVVGEPDMDVGHAFFAGF